MVEDGVTHAVSLVLAPHFSALSVARYQQKVADGLELYRGRIDFEHVASYHDAPGLVEAFAARVDEGLSRWPEDERDRVHVVFSAHSLPERVLVVGRSVRRAVPRDGAARRRARGARRRAAGRGRTSRRAARPSRGPGRTSASISQTLAAQGVRDVVVGAGRVRLRPRRAPLRRRPCAPAAIAERARHAARAAAGAERRPRLHRGARRASCARGAEPWLAGAQAA